MKEFAIEMLDILKTRIKAEEKILDRELITEETFFVIDSIEVDINAGILKPYKGND